MTENPKSPNGLLDTSVLVTLRKVRRGFIPPGADDDLRHQTGQPGHAAGVAQLHPGLRNLRHLWGRQLRRQGSHLLAGFARTQQVCGARKIPDAAVGAQGQSGDRGDVL